MGRWLLGMELARARAADQPHGREAALSRAGDAYERARRAGLGSAAEAGAPGLSS